MAQSLSATGLAPERSFELARAVEQRLAETGAGAFGSMLKEALGSVVEAGRNSDHQLKTVAAGNANIVDVVTAVAETEVAIEALVSVRDKVIQAYEEIMRMPI